MVDRIYMLKNMILERIMKEVEERGIERVDGELVDMVKDLAEAEESCWKAEYYRKVSEAMEGSSGYSGGQGMSGYSGGQGTSGYSGGQGGRSGYGAGTGSSAGYGGQTTAPGEYRGASGHTSVVDPLRMALQSANPDERQHLRNEIMTIIGAM